MVKKDTAQVDLYTWNGMLPSEKSKLQESI